MKPATTNPPGPGPGAPRILLVEDDAPSRAFLAAALTGLPARVATAAGAGEALMLAARGGAFDLWLLDAHLPDADGRALLSAMRLLAPATPAVAHTATRDPGYAASLRACGFDGVLLKPVAVAVLHATVRDALATRDRAAPPAATRRRASKATAVAEPPAVAWFATEATRTANAAHAHHDTEAPSPRGNARTRRASLRALFHAELPLQRASVERAGAPGPKARGGGVLPPQSASCGADPASIEALRRFCACVDAVLALGGGTVA